MFDSIGCLLRFPIFIVMVLLKIFVAFPFELIIFKILGSIVLLVLSTLGILKTITFPDRVKYNDHIRDIKEVFSLLYDFEAFNFSGTIHFLKHGHFK